MGEGTLALRAALQSGPSALHERRSFTNAGNPLTVRSSPCSLLARLSSPQHGGSSGRSLDSVHAQVGLREDLKFKRTVVKIIPTS